MLGALVEGVSGEDYYAYVREHVFQPAGMTHTASWPIDSLPADAAIGYTLRVDPSSDSLGTTLRENAPLLPGRGTAAGGGYSTAGDLLRYLAAVRTGKLPSMYPGWAGGSAGVNTVVEGRLPGGYELVVLENVDPPAAQDIARRVHEWLGDARGSR